MADGVRTAINIASPEHWPLQWYLRDYSGVAYWGKVIDQPDSPMIIGIDRERELLQSRLQGEYHKENYRLRPGTNLILYIQKKLWDEWFIDSIEEYEDAEISTGVVERGLFGRFYQGRDYAGEPILTRFDDGLSFNWTGARPVAGPFSVQWEGYIWIAQSGSYTFTTESDDGSWVFINEALVVDNGGAHRLRRGSGRIKLTKGNHRIRVNYFDAGGEAVLRITWQPPGREEGPIPANVLYSIGERKTLSPKLELEGKTASGLWGRYYRGVGFGGEIFLNRADTSFSFRWDREEDKPHSSPFSIEWEGFLLVQEEGEYTFTTESDDGSWVYLNEELIVDNGGTHAVRRASGQARLTPGYHYLRIRYFDSGGGAIFRLLWNPPGKNEASIPQEVFYYIKPG